jgi:putative hemolysin
LEPDERSFDFDPKHFGWQMGLVLALICVNALLSLAEYALITVRKTRIRQLVEEGNRSAILVEKLLKQPTLMQSTIQTGLTLVSTLAAIIAAVSAIGPLAHWIARHTALHGFVNSNASVLSLALVTLPVTIVSLIIGEIAPKSLALRHPERLALIAVYPVYGLKFLFTPLVALLTFLSNILVRPFGGTASFIIPAVNEEELKMMVEASEEKGFLEAEETEMIHSILDFGDTVVRKVMTPRIDMTALDVSAPLPELLRCITESGHSRIPVYEEDLDSIVGIVHAKDLLSLPLDTMRNNTSIRSVMRPPYFIPETKKGDELLAEFQRSKQQLAIVRDEYGVTSGLVTIEDLLEEIVGDIQDEYDQEEPMVQVVDRCTSILNGKMGLREVNDRMGLELPEDEADTIGGFVFGLLGHQAERGEKVTWQNVEFIVEASDGRRITKVRLVHNAPASAQPDASDAADTETPEAVPLVAARDVEPLARS